MLIGLLTGTFSVFGPRAEAVPIGPGTNIGNFEVDGDMAEAGADDWAGLDLASYLHFDDRYASVPPLTYDIAFKGGAKEFQRNTWGCVQANNGVSPSQADIDYVFAYPSISLSNQFVALGYVRKDPQGTFNISVEFTRNTLNSCSTTEDHTPGDLLLHIDFHGGDTFADFVGHVWDGDEFIEFDPPANVVNGVTNGSAFDLPASVSSLVSARGLPTTIAPKLFGEIVVDLAALQAAVASLDIEDVPPVLDCPGLGFANIRTRSSDEDQAQLKDLVAEIPIDLSNCADITIKKVDDSVPPVPTAGAVYGLYDSLAAAQAVAGQTDDEAKAAAVDWCTTAANGTCTFDEVDPDVDYWITEIAPPPGLLPSTEIRAVDADDIEPFGSLDLTGAPFVNNVPVGNVTITKRLFDDRDEDGVLDPGEEVVPDQLSDLDGITFELQQGGVTATTHPANQPAACTITGGTGSCTISSVRLGTYDILETLNPDGPSGIGLGVAPSVTIDENGETVQANYDNPLSPIDISLDKAGPDYAEVGETITYTFDVTTTGVPLTGVQVSELVDPPAFADRCDTSPLSGPTKLVGDQDDLLEADELWRWTCQHTVTFAEATDGDGPELWNKAQATGEDALGRDVSAQDTHKVIIKLPDVTVDKTPDDGVVLPGQDASFTITVSNAPDDGQGPPEGIARDVELTDTLPAGIDWSESSDDCTITGGVLSCEFGDLAPGEQVSVTVTGTTDLADCGALPNTASVSASNELDADKGNNTDDGLITVSCADVTVEKTAEDGSISAGETASFDIVVTNQSITEAASDVELEDPLPDGVDWELSGPDADDCEIEVDGETGEQTLTCDFGTIEASGTRTVTVSGETDAADCGTLVNTATVSSSNEAPGADDDNSSTAEIEVLCPDVYVEKSGPAEVSAGDDITWTITFGNTGPGDAFDVVMTDTLPAGLTYAALDAGDDAICDLVGSSLTCEFDVLEAGAEHVVTVTGTTGTDPSDCGDVTNPASISASNEATDDETQANNKTSATTDVECPLVDLVKEAGNPSTVSAGDPVSFTITVSNEDGEDVGIARDVTISDTLPSIPGYSWAIDGVSSEETDPCDLTGNVLSCDFGDLAPGEEASVTLVASLDEGADPETACGTYPNTATVTFANGVEVDDTNNSAEVTILCPGVNLSKTADAQIVEAGDQIGFTITVTNLDDGEDPPEGTAKDVVVTDTLPGDLDWEVADDSVLPDGASCEISEGTLTCDLGDLPAVGVEEAPQVTIHLVADTTPADCGVYDNTAEASVGNGVDPDDATAESRVRCPIAIDLDKTGPALAHVGDVVDYELTVTNTGGVDLLEVELTDAECDAGTIVLVDDGDGDAVLSAGTWDPETESFVDAEVWTYVCSRTLTEDDVVEVEGDNVAVNTAQVRGEDEDGREATDEDPHVVGIIDPAIDIVKTVDDATPDIGQTVTFTYVVTNTGDTTLFDIEVTDDQLGPIGTIDELEPGESVELTATMVVAADSPTLNIGTATGEDVLGKVVTDEDPETITIVLGEVITPPKTEVKGVQLPRTGTDARFLLFVSGLLLILGGALVASGQRWELRSLRHRRS